MRNKQQDLKSRIILALDFQDFEEGKSWIDRFGSQLTTFKMGPVMFLNKGFAGLAELSSYNIDLFLDLKLHDIPNTLSQTVANIVRNDISMFTIHSMGGYEMMNTVCNEVKRHSSETSRPRPMVLAVTVLTSHDRESLMDIGISGSVEDEVLRLAKLSDKAGVDGLVCSGYEVANLRKEFGERFKLIVPGVRINGDKLDQKRVVTPLQALSNGADYIVIGRSITRSPDPEATVDAIVGSLGQLPP